MIPQPSTAILCTIQLTVLTVQSSFHVQVKEDDTGDVIKRGTRVTLHLKEDAYELADEKKLTDLIKQYSEFIQFPIRQVTAILRVCGHTLV